MTRRTGGPQRDGPEREAAHTHEVGERPGRTATEQQRQRGTCAAPGMTDGHPRGGGTTMWVLVRAFEGGAHVCIPVPLPLCRWQTLP